MGTFSAKTKDKVSEVRFAAALPSPATLLLFSPLLIFGSGLLLTHLFEQRRREEVGVVH